MPAVSSFLLAAQIGGLALGATGTVLKAGADKDASEASKRAEDARKEQARLQYAREQRKIFRDQQAANAIGLSNITNAGGQSGSALGGLYGQTSGAADQQSFDLAQNAGIGNRIFQANADFAEAQGRSATYGGLQSLGKDIFAAAGPISRVGSTIFGGPNVDRGIHDWNRNTYTYKA